MVGIFTCSGNDDFDQRLSKTDAIETLFEQYVKELKFSMNYPAKAKVQSLVERKAQRLSPLGFLLVRV
jgi:hypothetical protein